MKMWGRHNAMDKVVGEASLKEIQMSDKIILTSGRGHQKCS
jgi:FdhD protein